MLVNNKGEARLADLGLSVDFAASAKKLHKPATTLLYRSPEQLFGLSEGYGLESDVWSLGVVLAELLLCEPLFCRARGYKEYVSLLVERAGKKGFEGWPQASNHPDFPKGVRSKGGSIAEYVAEKVGGVDGHTLDLLGRLLEVDPKRRIAMKEVLEHPYFVEEGGVVEELGY